MEQRLSGLSGRVMAAAVALALAASMALGATPAFALNNGGLTDDGTASITVHKYKTPAASSEPGTGSTADAATCPPAPSRCRAWTSRCTSSTPPR